MRNFGPRNSGWKESESQLPYIQFETDLQEGDSGGSTSGFACRNPYRKKKIESDFLESDHAETTCGWGGRHFGIRREEWGSGNFRFASAE